MIAIKQGEQKSINYNMFIKEQNMPFLLTNTTIIFQLKECPEQSENFLLEKIITEDSDPNDVGKIYDAQNGKFKIFFKAEDTLNLNIHQEYYYTIWRITENIKEVISANANEFQPFYVFPA